MPLTPIQRWFFALGLAQPHHWNQALLLDLREPVRVAVLERALERLVAHHDALRLRFAPAGGTWEQTNAGLGSTVSCEVVDLACCRKASARRTGAAGGPGGSDQAPARGPRSA